MVHGSIAVVVVVFLATHSSFGAVLQGFLSRGSNQVP